MSSIRTAALVATALGFVSGFLGGFQLVLAAGYGPFSAVSDAARIGTTLLGIVVSPVFVTATGYWVGSRVDIQNRYGALALWFSLGGGAAVFLGYLGATALPPELRFGGYVAPALIRGLVAAVEYPLFGVGGAAVAHFRQ